MTALAMRWHRPGVEWLRVRLAAWFERLNDRFRRWQDEVL